MRYRHIATGEVVRVAGKTVRGFILVDANGNRLYVTPDELAAEYREIGRLR